MKKINYLLIVTVFVLVFSLISAAGQTSANRAATPVTTAANAPDYLLVIENADGKQTKLTPADLSALKRQTVKVNDHDKAAVFEGFALVDVLKLGGVEFGEKMRGKELAKFLLVKAADNYQVVFALAELEPTFTDKIVILADRRDGGPLAKTEGELRIVVPDEKKAGRWVRQVVSLKIVNAYIENK